MARRKKPKLQPYTGETPDIALMAAEAGEPVADDSFAAALGDPAEETAARDERARSERLQGFGATLSGMRDRWIVARRAMGIDQRFKDALETYNAEEQNNKKTDMMATVAQGYPVTSANPAAQHRSTVTFGLTRQKTNAIEARFSDIVLPTEDNNFGIAPTPNPRLVRRQEDDTPLADESGAPITYPLIDPRTGEPSGATAPLKQSDLAEREMRKAQKAAGEMEKEIADQFVECDANAEFRAMARDAAKLGTGVVKGPIATSRVRRAWLRDEQLGTYVLQVVQETKPASFRVNPLYVWCDPASGDNIHRGTGVFEFTAATRKMVQDLAKQPGYMPDALRQVLTEGPIRCPAFADDFFPANQNYLQEPLFDKWEYHGELAIEDLRAAGAPGLPATRDDDPLTMLSGCVVMVNNTVVKAYLNPMESGDIPYDFLPWETDGWSPWGFGVPHLMKAQQAVLNSAWRQMMDNAGLSSGPQIVVRSTGIKPADGAWVLASRKIWWADDSVQDVEKAFQVFEFASHQAELAAIIALAQDFADKETGAPQLTQGERGNAPDTLGGMQLLMNNANVVLRRLVKQFDDKVTKPHVRRYYDYNMEHSEKDEIKGDFSVQAKGVSALLVRDLQKQALMEVLQLAGHPVFGPLLKPRDALVEALKARHLTPDTFVKDVGTITQEEEMRAKAPPQDPRVQAALVKSEADAKRATAQAASFESEIQLRKDIAEQNLAARIEQLKLDRELGLLKYATDQKITLEAARAQLTAAAMRERGANERFAAESALKLNPQNPSGEGV